MLRKRRRIRTDDVLGWVSMALLVILMVVLDRYHVDGKWFHAACWTALALTPALSVHRRKWSVSRFWARWAICAAVHLALMIWIFRYLIPDSLRLRHIFILPGSIEGFFISIWAGAGRVQRQDAKHVHAPSHR